MAFEFQNTLLNGTRNSYRKLSERDLTMERTGKLRKPKPRELYEVKPKGVRPGSQQNRGPEASNIDPWKGKKIPHVPTNASESKDFSRSLCISFDHTYRLSDVSKEVDGFNAMLEEITRKSTGGIREAIYRYLPPIAQKECEEYVIDISRRFADYSRKATKDYGKCTGQYIRQKAFKELKKLNSDFKNWYKYLVEAKKRWPVIAEIEKHKIYLSEEQEDEIKDKIKVAYNMKEEVKESPWTEVDRCLKEIKLYVYKEGVNKIRQRFQTCQDWFDTNCQSRELEQFKNDVYRYFDYIGRIEDDIDKEMRNHDRNNKVKDYLEEYDKQVRRFEKKALDVIKGSTKHHEQLDTLMQRSEKAVSAAIYEIDRNNNLTEAEKRELRNDSLASYKDAHLSIMRAVRACGPREKPERRYEALIEAEDEVFWVEMDMLEHSSPQDYSTLCRLKKDAKAMASRTTGIIDRKGLSAGQKQASKEHSSALYNDACRFMGYAVRVCGQRKASSEQRYEALIEAENRVFRVEMNMLEHNSPQDYKEFYRLQTRVDRIKGRIRDTIDGYYYDHPEEKKRAKKDSFALCQKAYRSIMYAARKCGDPELRASAHADAKEQVFQVEMNMLKYSRPQDYKEFSKLRDKAEKRTIHNADAFINANVHLSKEKKEKLIEDSLALYQDANRSIMDAVKACMRENPEERYKALRTARDKVDRLNKKMGSSLRKALDDRELYDDEREYRRNYRSIELPDG
jgi:hypothetical protein